MSLCERVSFAYLTAIFFRPHFDKCQVQTELSVLILILFDVNALKKIVSQTLCFLIRLHSDT